MLHGGGCDRIQLVEAIHHPVTKGPSGIPVATVAINGAENAAILAAQILAVSDREIADKLKAGRKAMAEAVMKKDAALTNGGKN